MPWQVSDHEVTLRRRRVESIAVERRQGGMASTRVEAWLEESEVVHVRHLTVELSDIDTETRGDASTARGLPMPVLTRAASAGAAKVPTVQL